MSSAPSPAQLEAGNYRKERRRFRGLDVTIENPVGSVRRGRGWAVKMAHAYGYIRGTLGVDGDHFDCLLGPDEAAETVYLATTMAPPRFDAADEQKALLGFASEAAARAAFLGMYDDPRFLGALKAVPFERFKRDVLTTRENPRMLKADSVILFFSADPLLKAQVKGANTGDLFSQGVSVAGYTTKTGTVVAPHRAHRRKRILVAPVPEHRRFQFQGNLFSHGGEPPNPPPAPGSKPEPVPTPEPIASSGNPTAPPPPEPPAPVAEPIQAATAEPIPTPSELISGTPTPTPAPPPSVPETVSVQPEPPAATEPPVSATPEPVPATGEAGPEIVEYTTRKGKVIRGVVRKDLTFAQAKAIDEYTFKHMGGWFIREKHLGRHAQAHSRLDQAAEAGVISAHQAAAAKLALAEGGIARAAAELRATPPERPNFGWKAVELARHYSVEELVAMAREVERDPRSANPDYKAGRSIFIHTKAARRKLDAITWAITHILKARKGEAGPSEPPGPLAKSFDLDTPVAGTFDAAAAAAVEEARGDAVTAEDVGRHWPGRDAEDAADMLHASGDYAVLPSGEHFLPMDRYLSACEPAAEIRRLRERLDAGGVPDYLAGRMRAQAGRLVEHHMAR